MQVYADSIKQLVNGYSSGTNNVMLLSSSTYSLQYNKVKDSNGNWVISGGAYDNRWLNYNCYAYSIKRNEFPKYYSSGRQYQPGDMTDDDNTIGAINRFYDCNNITDLADLVRKDLLAMGYNNITISDSVLPVNASQELICVRMNEVDYHFMHYDQGTNAWYHKPGNTAVLKYNYIPNNSQYWYPENSFKGIEYGYDEDDRYDSNIKFIRYNKNYITLSNSITNVSTNINVQQGKDTILEINNLVSGSYMIFLSSNSEVVLEIYNYEMTLLNTYTGTNISKNRYLSNATYYLKFNFLSNTSSGNITIEIEHGHSYSNWRYFSRTQHIEVCDCGATGTTTRPHVVSASDTGTRRQCLECHHLLGPLDLALIMYSTRPLYTSINGSYILPNGIIVLVDEDIEAYFNGALVFNQGGTSPA